MTKKRHAAGGAAMGGGAAFQARVAAWAAAHVLAEADAQPPLGLTSPASVVGCEGADPVDDVLVRGVNGQSAYVQVKRTLSLSARRRVAGRPAPLASAIDQFVRQFHAGTLQAAVHVGPFDPGRDLLVLAVAGGAPASIRQILRAVLDRVRLQPEDAPLRAPVLNADERRALSVIVNLARQSWREATGTIPPDRELHRFLRLVHVQTIDVEQGGPAEQAAKGLLRTNVLEEPGQSDQAWALLVSIGARLISLRGTADQPALVRELRAAGIQVRGPRSYREDFDRLRYHSAAIVNRLADYASIPLGAVRVEIARPHAEAVRAAAENGSVLIVGEPGAGKSGVMFGLARALAGEGRDAITLVAQDPPFASLGELRDELQLAHGIVDVLANWLGEEPAFLLIDALDAARTDPAAKALRQLMREVTERAPRWRVVASIREYDVRYGRDVRKTFEGDPPPGPSPRLPGADFAHVRHIVVGGLTEGELTQLKASAPRLHELVRTAPAPLTQLLHNPFNLRLAAELLDAGTDPTALRGLKSQLDLLDLYWTERVFGAGEARESGAREAVLRTAVEAMVRARSLRADRDLVEADPAAAPALSDVLSARVLTEWSPVVGYPPRRSTLTFAHHVLFDYAVARLLLRRTSVRLVDLLTSDPAFVLLARPSLVMHFHHLWDLVSEAGAHEEFWDVVLAVARAADIPEIGKLIGPGVAAERAGSIQEFRPLLAGLAATDDQKRASGENAFNHVVRSVLGQGLGVERLGLWAGLLELVSRSFRDGTAYPARSLLSDLTERTRELPPEQRQELGVASRRLLEYAWRRPQRDRWIVIHAIQCVLRTFATDPSASAALLRTSIEPGHLAAHGAEELRWFADGVPELAVHDPDLVRGIYAAAFGYRETSDAPTPMGGVVIPMVSNRRQDYESGLYSLARAYQRFLRIAPDRAIAAMSSALEGYVAREHPPRKGPESFRLNGRDTELLADYSHIWDRGRHPHEYAVELLDHVEHRLDELAGPDGNHHDRQRLLALISSGSRVAVVWRRLLRLAARHPRTVGLDLRELAWSLPILTCSDTSTLAGEMIRTVVRHLPQDDRERVERAILSVPKTVQEPHRERAQVTSDRLLGCIPDAAVVTREARERLASLRATGGAPSNEDIDPIQVTSRSFGEPEYLAEEGVPVDDAPNRRIREIEEPVQRFASEYLNREPDESAVSTILPHLRALRDALRSADADGVHPEQAKYVWGALAEACAVVARVKDLSCGSEAGAFVRAVLLDASRHEVPAADPEADEKFDDAHWSKPAARIDAAAGLASLVFHPSCADEQVLTAVERLCVDPSPAVRYQVAARLRALYRHSPERCWTLIERMATEDRSRGVLRGLLELTLHPLRFADPDWVGALTISIYERTAAWPGSEEVQNDCVIVLADLFLVGKHDGATRIIEHIADHPLEHLEQAVHLASAFREILVDGPPDGSNPAAEAARRRAIDFVHGSTRSAAQAFRRGAQPRAGKNGNDRGEAPTEKQMQQLAHLVDGVASNLYFVSGAFEDQGSAVPEPQVQARLLREAGPIIDELADVGLPTVTHHLLETLEVLVPFDPCGVFMRVAAAILGGTKGGYQYDALAEEVLVRLVERYLAEHRDIFQSDEEARRALIAVLDTFVRAGSVGARRLSYGLDGIFR